MEYTKENYIDFVPLHGNYLDCPAHSSSITPYMNGVSPIYVRNQDEFIGKTVDFYYENTKTVFVGFTDNTFVIKRPHTLGLDNFSLEFSTLIVSCVCVYDGQKSTVDDNVPYSSKEFAVRITTIGRWLQEHTDADIIGFYEKVKKEREEITERIKKNKQEEEYKLYLSLKEKYENKILK